MRLFPGACVDLLSRLTRNIGVEPSTDWLAALREIGAAIVGALPDLKVRERQSCGRDWWRIERAKPVDPTTVADLLKLLQR